MLGYLSKFVLQMLPTISATVIGAYIVATWINPKTPPEPAKVAARAQGQGPQGVTASHPAGQPAQQETAREAELAAPADSGDDTSPVKTAARPETIRIIPIVKQPQPSFDAAANPEASAAPESVAQANERRDANELARAAIQRQRAGTEAPRAADEPAKQPVVAVRAQPQSRPVPEATVAPPLPPAVTIAAPRYPQDAGADQASSPRLTPPAEIPTVGNPLSLHASHRVVAQSPSPADDFLNATRSFFRALTPQ